MLKSKRATARLFAGTAGFVLYTACSLDPGAKNTGAGAGTTGAGGSMQPAGTGDGGGVGNGGSGTPGGGGGMATNGGGGSAPTAGSQNQGGSTPGTDGGTGGSAGIAGAAGGGAGAGGTMVQPDDATCSNFTMPRLQVLAPFDAQAVQLATSMTAQQKITMLSGPPCPTFACFFGNGVTGVNPPIPQFQMRDGPRGLHAINGSATQSWPSSTWAVAEARAASFDLDLEYRVGVAQGAEAYAMLADVVLAPVVNTLRNPLWARAQETYGEDPVLLGEMGAAFTRGLQQTVHACPKHFVMNDTDNNRLTANAIVDEQTLRENYTRPFEIVVKKGDPACIMAAYNQVNGTHSTENRHILTDILRTDWGWQGYVISDWWATVPADGARSMTSGLDMEMPDQAAFQALPSALSSGAVMAARITEAATRVLNARAKFKGLTAAYQNRAQNTTVANDPAHVALARETEEKGAVLLKNGGSDTTRILPLGPKATELGFGTSNVTTIAVVGPDSLLPIAPSQQNNNANNFVSGLGDRGSSQTIPPHAVSFIQGLRNIILQKGLNITVRQSADASAAAGASVVIVPVTMAHEDEGEAYNRGADRQDFTLSGVHPIHWGAQKPAAFINAVAATNPNVVVLLAVGSAIVMEDWLSSARGIVQTFYPGQEGGDAVARLLFGDINFSGKLPFTVAQNPADYPPFQNAANAAMIDYLHGYRRFEGNQRTPRFWFGYGMSYTTYEYSNLTVLCSNLTTTGRLNVQVTVKNTGMMAGDEVVQLYIGYPHTTARRPPKELKAFTRVTLAAGQSKDVQLNVPVADMAYWGTSGWTIEKIEHAVLVGPSADPTKLLSAMFTIH